MAKLSRVVARPRKKIIKQTAHSNIRIIAVVFGSLAVLFIGINVIIYLVFLGRTFPNTRVANYPIGAVNYSTIPKKISSLALLPPAISLTGHGHTVAISPSQLGIQINSSAITAAARHKAWLPIQNLLVSHKLPVNLTINQDELTKKLQSLTPANSQDPVNAQISLQGNQFSLLNAKDGYQLAVAKAAVAITHAAHQNKTAIELSFTVIPPKISDASLESTLQQLRAQQGVFLDYMYNGTTTRPSAATIASWYSVVNNQYVVQPAKIQAYITQVGTTSGIHVQNISQAVTATEAAIQKILPMTFTLVAVPPSICSPNTINQLVIVSISQRHLWACNTYTQVYDSAVVTGMQNLPADLTPTGTYKVHAKQTNLYLNGSDSTGAWHDYVNYWMPFLSNQYGTYGFHDATWRAASDFGTISPDSPDASHGCVELPLDTAKWLYGWITVGATVTINS
jgi:lipoprotein-anchoring transpeptidase ErfK/SrfK